MSRKKAVPVVPREVVPGLRCAQMMCYQCADSLRQWERDATDLAQEREQAQTLARQLIVEQERRATAETERDEARRKMEVANDCIRAVAEVAELRGKAMEDAEEREAAVRRELAALQQAVGEAGRGGWFACAEWIAVRQYGIRADDLLAKGGGG